MARKSFADRVRERDNRGLDDAAQKLRTLVKSDSESVSPKKSTDRASELVTDRASGLLTEPVLGFAFVVEVPITAAPWRANRTAMA